MIVKLCDLCKKGTPDKRFKVKMSTKNHCYTSGVSGGFTPYRKIEICEDCAEKLFGIESYKSFLNRLIEKMTEKFNKNTLEYKMFLDFWNLCQRYWIVENNDKYWNELIRDIDKFYEKYKNKGGTIKCFSKKIAVAFIEHLCNQSKNN